MKMVYKIGIKKKSSSSKTKAQRSVPVRVIIIITTQTLFEQFPKSVQLAAELAAPATC